MYERYHGVDRHSTSLTIKIVDQNGILIKTIGHCSDFMSYIKTLNEKDAVLLEAGNSTFYLADKIEEQGATPFVLNPRLFKLISKSTKKTDKNDAMVLARSLRKSLIDKDGDFGLPLVYKPLVHIRELRRMFSGLRMINKNLVQAKNTVLGMLSDTGHRLEKTMKNDLFNPKSGHEFLISLQLKTPDEIVISSLLGMIFTCLTEKKKLNTSIIQFGDFFQNEVELLISIKGVSPLLALAFLADVADIKRFKSIRTLNAYLGVVPITRSSGGKEFHGHIIRQSRPLTRTMFTQAVQHIGRSSASISSWYDEIRERRGIGRARIALIRKTIKIMRRMLLDQKLYKDVDLQSYKIKLANYERILKKGEKLKKIAA